MAAANESPTLLSLIQQARKVNDTNQHQNDVRMPNAMPHVRSGMPQVRQQALALLGRLAPGEDDAASMQA